jgi:hypothetical protein
MDGPSTRPMPQPVLTFIKLEANKKKNEWMLYYVYSSQGDSENTACMSLQLITLGLGAQVDKLQLNKPTNK